MEFYENPELAEKIVEQANHLLNDGQHPRSITRGGEVSISHNEWSICFSHSGYRTHETDLFNQVRLLRDTVEIDITEEGEFRDKPQTTLIAIGENSETGLPTLDIEALAPTSQVKSESPSTALEAGQIAVLKIAAIENGSSVLLLDPHETKTELEFMLRDLELPQENSVQ